MTRTSELRSLPGWIEKLDKKMIVSDRLFFSCSNNQKKIYAFPWQEDFHIHEKSFGAGSTPIIRL
jgi:hypothetical protein